jgi:hypothetical protein
VSYSYIIIIFKDIYRYCLPVIATKLNRARSHSQLLHLHGPVTVPYDPGERCVAGAGLALVLTDYEDGAGGVGAGHSKPSPTSTKPSIKQIIKIGEPSIAVTPADVTVGSHSSVTPWSDMQLLTLT